MAPRPPNYSQQRAQRERNQRAKAEEKGRAKRGKDRAAESNQRRQNVSDRRYRRGIELTDAHAEVAVYHEAVLAMRLALCPTSSYAVERRGFRWPCEILASAASFAAFRHLA